MHGHHRCGPYGHRGIHGWGHGFGHGRNRSHWAEQFSKFFHRVPVNIKETATAFELELYASGLQKEQFKVQVKDDVLIIGYEGTEQESKQGFTRREYHEQSFERSFELNGKVLTAQVSAEYDNGILKVLLPKDPETNRPAQDINVG